MKTNPQPNEAAHEKHLVELARGGDGQAFGELVEQFQPRLYPLVYRYVGNAEDAGDCCQQVWIKVWRNLPKFQARSRFYTWLYRIAVFVSLDFIRKRSRRREAVYLDEWKPHAEGGLEAASPGDPPDARVQQHEIMEQFMAAVQGLSPEHRMTLLLREVEGLAYDEIARVMKCRRGTVMSRLYYARRVLRSELQELK